MLHFLPTFLKGVISFLLFVLNTLFWCVLLYFFAFLKIIVLSERPRRLVTRAMVWVGESWIRNNSAEIALMHKMSWDVRFQGVQSLRLDRSYLVLVNHQSWVDIVVLQHIFNRKIPFLRFFLKKELIYVPLLGIAWWALDFPFMQRHSKEYLKKHPDKKGEDLETTKRACEKFRGAPISVLNFVEGTRFNAEKKERQSSPFQRLLRPKSGGVGFVLEAMGSQFQSVLNVTIKYEQPGVSMWDLFSGQIQRVQVVVEELEIPKAFLSRSYQNDADFRVLLQAWLNAMWAEKDKLLQKLDDATPTELTSKQ